jgi:hypothetical protein
MNATLKSAYLKIERAAYHIHDLEHQTAAFFNSAKSILVEEIEPSSGDRIAKVKMVTPFPDMFSLIAGDTITNIRASLDHLATALAKLKDPNPKDVHFPFAGDYANFVSAATEKKIKAFPAEAKDIFNEIKPYRGGNDLLWAINRNRNKDVHNFVIPVGSYGSLRGISNFSFSNPKGGITFDGRLYRLDEGIVVINLGHQGTMQPKNEEAQISVDGEIVFRDAEIISGEPVINTLKKMHDTVLNIVFKFETKFFNNYS